MTIFLIYLTCCSLGWIAIDLLCYSVSKRATPMIYRCIGLLAGYLIADYIISTTGVL